MLKRSPLSVALDGALLSRLFGGSDRTKLGTFRATPWDKFVPSLGQKGVTCSATPFLLSILSISFNKYRDLLRVSY
jgi:hypothetical protein